VQLYQELAEFIAPTFKDALTQPPDTFDPHCTDDGCRLRNQDAIFGCNDTDTNTSYDVIPLIDGLPSECGGPPPTTRSHEPGSCYGACGGGCDECATVPT